MIENVVTNEDDSQTVDESSNEDKKRSSINEDCMYESKETNEEDGELKLLPLILRDDDDEVDDDVEDDGEMIAEDRITPNNITTINEKEVSNESQPLSNLNKTTTIQDIT